MNPFELAASHIIKEQEGIIGPLAFDQARKVAGIQVDNTGNVTIAGDGKEVLNNLVHQYSELFGHASVEVCKEAIREITPTITPDVLPDILK